MRGQTLFTYCIPIDDGAAPNPYWEICTLNICKPVIRRVANVGDWVVGTGSVKFDCADHVVYAMKVTQKMTMAEYDSWVKQYCPEKEADWGNGDHRRRLGDSIYDFTTDPPKQRKGVHGSGNVKTDLGGQCTLLSTHFYYFGNKPVLLPEDLRPIVKQGQAHRSRSNQPFLSRFVSWIEGFEKSHNLKPQLNIFITNSTVDECADHRAKCSSEDEVCGDEI